MARDAIDIKASLGALVMVLALLLAAPPAWAQRDRMSMGEQLGATVFRAQPETKGIAVSTPAEPTKTSASPAAVDAVKLQESISTTKK